MKKNTIRNIIFAILGAFLFGLGIDRNTWAIGTIGFILMLIAMCLAMSDSENE